MNFRTTFALLILVLVGVGGFLLWSPDAPEKGAASVEPEVTRKLLEFKSETDDTSVTIVKMVLDRPEKDTVVFERAKKEDKPDEYDKWQMAEPFAAKAVDYPVNSLANKVRDLKYRQKDDGITDETAGLNPPRATITITAADGTAHTVEVGKSVASEKTFVRIKDAKSVYVVDAKFDDDLKKKLDEYRDKDLVELTTADASEIQVVHEGKKYSITRDDKKDWVFSEPFAGYGDNSKIKSIADSLNWLRADEFVDDKPTDLKAYGLDAPRLSVVVTTAKEIKSDDEEEDAEDEESDDEEDADEEKEPKIERKTFGAAFGAFADLEEKKVYAKLVDQPFVVTVNKTDFEKFVPKPNEWRELKITRAAARTATKVELAVAGKKTALTKEGNKWQMSEGGADIAAVDGLLKAVVDLKATRYREMGGGSEAEFGLDKPRAVLTLTIPGQTDPETITVGGESKSKTMAYVRRGASGSIGVVRAETVEKLLRTPVAYRDRKIFRFARSGAKRIELSRRSTATGGRTELVLEKENGAKWSLTSPIKADTERQAVRDMLADLSSLRAKAVVEQGDGSAYGLKDPDVRVKVTVESKPPRPASKPATTQPSTQVAASQPTTTKPAVAASQPAEPPKPVRKVYDLAVTKKDDKTYARYTGSDLVYEIDSAVHDHVIAEVLDRTVAKIETSQVTGLEIVRGGQTDRSHKFGKQDDKWAYVTDPDVTIDESKVTELLSKVTGLQAVRFADYAAADLKVYQLDKPEYTVTVTRDDGEPVSILISGTEVKTTGSSEPQRYATVKGTKRVLLLKNEDVENFDKSVSDFEKKPS